MMTMALVLVTATFANAQEIPTPTHTVYCLGCRGTQAPAYQTPTLPMTYMTVPVRVPMQPTGYTQTTRNYPTPLTLFALRGTQTQVNYAPVTQQPPPYPQQSYPQAQGFPGGGYGYSGGYAGGRSTYDVR